MDEQQHDMAKEQIRDRVRLLTEKIAANEDENRFMLEEINILCKRHDALELK